MHNLFSRSSKIIKLVLLASFKHVLSWIHIHVHHLITYVHMKCPFHASHTSQNTRSLHFIHNEYTPLLLSILGTQ